MLQPVARFQHLDGFGLVIAAYGSTLLFRRARRVERLGAGWFVATRLVCLDIAQIRLGLFERSEAFVLSLRIAVNLGLAFLPGQIDSRLTTDSHRIVLLFLLRHC